MDDEDGIVFCCNDRGCTKCHGDGYYIPPPKEYPTKEQREAVQAEIRKTKCPGCGAKLYIHSAQDLPEDVTIVWVANF